MIAPDASERAAGSGAPDRDGVGARVVGPPVQDAVRIRGIADEAPIVLWITDAAGACTYLNGAWYAYTGQSESEALGLGWLCAVHPEDKPEAERILLAANAARKPFRMEYRLRRADGVYRWAMDLARPRFADGGGGEFLGFVGSVIDVHVRRQAEGDGWTRRPMEGGRRCVVFGSGATFIVPSR